MSKQWAAQKSRAHNIHKLIKYIKKYNIESVYYIPNNESQFKLTEKILNAYLDKYIIFNDAWLHDDRINFFRFDTNNNFINIATNSIIALERYSLQVNNKYNNLLLGQVDFIRYVLSTEPPYEM